jgi:hypothetical protein
MNGCTKCPARVTWALTANGKRMPLDAEPVPGGNLEIKDGVIRYVKPEPGVRRYVSHFVTCPAAAQFRKAQIGGRTR